jgi:hypothetical protein
MKGFTRRGACGVLAATLLARAQAQVGGGGGGGGGIGGGGGVGPPRRNVDGQGINYAAEPAVYAVLSIDLDAKTVELRAANGRTGVVQVGPSVYDLSKLKAGDRIKVDFVLPDDKNKELRAASIWPAE